MSKRGETFVMNGSRKKHSFFRFSIIQMLILIAVVGLLLALVGPKLQRANVRRLNARLQAAAQNGDARAAFKAIAAGADVDALDDEFHTPLSYAIMAKDAELIDILLDADANVNLPCGKRSLTPLDFAVSNDDLTLATRLLDSGASFGNKDLHVCIERGYVEMHHLLLERGADTELKAIGGPNDGKRPLQVAIECNHTDGLRLRLVEQLLTHGADIHADAPSLRDAMSLAIRRSDAEVGRLLIKHGAEYTPREAAAFNWLEDLKGFVERKPSILHQRVSSVYYAKPGQEPTLLGIALTNGCREVAQFLIDAGASLDTLQFRDTSMLHLAGRSGDTELIQQLIARQVDINAVDYAGDTTLHEAVQGGRSKVVEVLLENGADTTIANGLGLIPLDLARRSGNSEFVELLEERTTDALHDSTSRLDAAYRKQHPTGF
jgi:uncharacterized protein